MVSVVQAALLLIPVYRYKHQPDLPLRMPAWSLFICLVLFGSCKGFLFNVSRGAQGVSRDLFSNVDPSGTCPRTNAGGRSWCLTKNAECSQEGCCMCACSYKYSTFRMDSSMNSATCVENSAFRNFAGCSTTFQGISTSHPLVTLDLALQNSKGIKDVQNKDNCAIDAALYLNKRTWIQLSWRVKYTFGVGKTRNWPYIELKWNGSMPRSYFGYIMKLNIICGKGTKFCVLFKAKGSRTWDVPGPTDEAPFVTPARSTTAELSTTTKVTTPVKSTTKAITTARANQTSSSTKAPSSKEMTTEQIVTKGITAKTSPKVTKVTMDSTAVESTATTPKQMEPMTGEVTTTEPTGYNPGSQEPNKGENNVCGKEEEEHDDAMMIAIIAGVAAVICVAIVLLCVWLVISQRKKKRYSANRAGTTVFANPTSNSQNHFPMPTLLKNPIYDDTLYAEPEDSAKKATFGLLGNPSYDAPLDLLLMNPGAKDGQSTPLNNIRMKPINSAGRKIHRENSHDGTVQSSRGKLQDGEKLVYHNPGCLMDGEKPAYESLTKENAARIRFNSQSNVGMYQSLDPHSLMYQPLQKKVRPKRQDEIPEYLALLNPNENPRNISPSPPEYQPPYSTGPPPADVDESPEYADYADLDELEEIATKEGSKKCSNHVHKGPSDDQALPGTVVYGVLEGPDPDSTGLTSQSCEPPVYAVLEGPDTAP